MGSRRDQEGEAEQGIPVIANTEFKKYLLPLKIGTNLNNEMAQLRGYHASRAVLIVFVDIVVVAFLKFFENSLQSGTIVEQPDPISSIRHTSRYSEDEDIIED